MTGTAKALVEKARETNARRSVLERAAGFAAPEQGPDDALLRTAMTAFHAGLEIADWDCVAEGYDMLCALHKRMTGIDYDLLSEPEVGR
jgi:hypothetical protein